jgi:DNA-directed RNA polymerase alpha subunit
MKPIDPNDGNILRALLDAAGYIYAQLKIERTQKGSNYTSQADADFLSWARREAATQAMQLYREVEIAINGNDVAQIFLHELEIQIRTYNVLKKANFKTVSDIFDYVKHSKLAHLKNFGRVSLHDLQTALSEKYGLELRDYDGNRP